MRFNSFIVVSVAGLLAWSAPARAGDWTSLGLDQGRSRATTERSGATFRGGEWRYTLPAVSDTIDRVLVSSPAVADGFAVFGTTTGEVIALGASDGLVRWRFRARDGLHASPAIIRGKVLVPSFDGNLYALRLADGQPLWTHNLGSVTFSSPAPVGDSVVVATGFPARKLIRLDAATGKVLWETADEAMDQASNSSVAVAGDQVLVGAMAGTYYSFDLATGAPRWTYSAGGAVHLTTPLVVDGKAYFAPGGSSHAVHAIDTQTGKAVTGWPLEIPNLPADTAGGTVKERDYAVSSLALAGGRLLFQQRMLELIDSNADGSVDTYLMREETIAVDRQSAAIVWRTSNGRVLTQDLSVVPAFGVCPSPLTYADRAGRLFAATASTLGNQVRILDAATGVESWSKGLSGPTRSSPVVANGRLIVATDAGVVHGLLSDVNQPPVWAVAGHAQPPTVPTVGAVVTWQGAVDPEGDATQYALRIDRDGEVLSSWEHELTLTAGETSAQLPWALQGGVTYTFAVRARDPSGAWSDWTAPQKILAVETPTVTVGDTGAASLQAALGSAQPGDIIHLGAGTFRLTETLRVPAGVNVRGAGPQRTLLDGSGLGAAVSIRGSSNATSGSAATGIAHLTVAGGRVGVSIADSRDASVRNVVVRGSTENGILVEGDATAEVVNATIVRAAVAVRAAGSVAVRNSLILDNDIGLQAAGSGRVASTFNDVHGNVHDYDNVSVGTGDLDQTVAFVDDAGNDFHLRPQQPTTDRGDPGDEWNQEPAPNGGRVNLGAFGNTADAETSQPPPGQPDPPGTPDPTTPTTPDPGPKRDPSVPLSGIKPAVVGVPGSAEHQDPRSSGGCALAGAPGDAGWSVVTAAVLLGVLIARRRRGLPRR